MNSLLGNIPDFEALLAYVYGALEPNAAAQLASRIDADERLRFVVAGIREVQEMQGFSTARAHAEWLDARQAAASRRLQSHIRQNQRRRTLRRLACAAALIGCCLYALHFPQNSAEKLYARFQLEPGEVSRISAADASQAGLRYLTGFRYLENGDTEAAIRYFSSAYEQASHPLIQHQALWQIGLAYLKAQDFDHAIGVFQAVRDQVDVTDPGEKQLAREVRKVLRRAKIRRFALGVYGCVRGKFAWHHQEYG